MKPEEYKILIVDDSVMNLEVLSRILRPGADGGGAGNNYRVLIAKSGAAALEKATSEKPDLILMDIIMPGMNGFDVLHELKQSDITRHIPVIIITGLDGVADEERGFELGAVDYITKPFHTSLVRARVMTHLRIVEQMRIIERLSLTDTLTGLPNRRNFDNRLSVEWGRAIREGVALSMLMIDIDHFKRYNDTYGHQRGDIVLGVVAGAIQSHLKRAADLAARWGGEEFAVILPDTNAEGAQRVAEQIRRGIESSPLGVTVSVGGATMIPAIENDADELLRQADAALYDAKESGRNRVEMRI